MANSTWVFTHSLVRPRSALAREGEILVGTEVDARPGPAREEHGETSDSQKAIGLYRDRGPVPRGVCNAVTV